MRAGNLDRTIILEAYTQTGVNDYNEPVLSWTTFATVRAQLIQAKTDEFLAGSSGVIDRQGVVFRIRWIDSLTAEHRVTYDGRTYDIKAITEIGRRRGLELRCEEQLS